MSVTVSAQVEIAAPPERVREMFLDFSKIPSWVRDGNIKSIQPPAGKTTVEPGDKLQVALTGMKFSPLVIENSPSCLKWRGGIPYVVAGYHSFRFEPSKTSPGSTTFVNEETFTGFATFLCKPFMGAQTSPGFQAFAQDFKAHVEASSK